MWTHLDADSATLEQVFEPLRARAIRFGRMWSIAELRLPANEIEWLKLWFDCLTPEHTENWVKSVQLTKSQGDLFVTYRQMIGALLICAGAEVCREESTEHSVWPVIGSILPKSHELRYELFLSNGQPTSLTKGVIADAARALSLRHAMDIEGTQQWFITLKLQFGFTRRGAKNRLAEWLVHIGRPHAVQYLLGEDGVEEFSDIVSDSFKSLWNTLTQYRRGLIDDIEARDILCNNPWIKPCWLEELLKEAKSRIATLGEGLPVIESREASGVSDEFCPISKIALDWLDGEVPRFRIHLDRQSIEEQVSGLNVAELDFYIDGNRLCRWLRQKDGSWNATEAIHAEPDSKRTQPNLTPRSLVVQTSSGEPLVEWDLSNSGLSESVLIFDQVKERMLQAGFERMNPTRAYAFVCDRDCQIQGGNVVETYERNGIARKVVRLGLPLNENLDVSFKDFVLCQPLLPPDLQTHNYALFLRTLGSTPVPLNSRSELIVEGLPENTKSAALLIHKTTYPLDRFNGIWTTLRKISMTPQLATRQRRVSVRFQTEVRIFTRIPQLELNLVGAAMLRHSQKEQHEIPLETLKDGSDVNLMDKTASIWIWTPERDKNARLFEGGYQAGRLRSGKIRLNQLAGNGGELQVLSGVERFPIGIRFHDTGCVGHFLPAMLGNTTAQLGMIAEKPPSDVGENGYVLFEWKPKNTRRPEFAQLPHSCVRDSSTERLWQLKYSSNPLAVALTWKGAWLGSWTSLERIRDYLRQHLELSTREFAILKWLRVPLLHPTLSSEVQTAVLNSPCRFLNAWLNDEGLPDGVVQQRNFLGLDTVIRHFLWNYFPPAHAKKAISLIPREKKADQVDQWINHLTKLAKISPILLWTGMEMCLNQTTSRIIELLNSFMHMQVSSSSRQQLDYRLGQLADQTTQITGMAEEKLEEILRVRLDSMKNRDWHPLNNDGDALSRVGETDSGRRYFSIRMAQYWLDLTHPQGRKTWGKLML